VRGAGDGSLPMLNDEKGDEDEIRIGDDQTWGAGQRSASEVGRGAQGSCGRLCAIPSHAKFLAGPWRRARRQAASQQGEGVPRHGMG
jgi:hypothetical protein